MKAFFCLFLVCLLSACAFSARDDIRSEGRARGFSERLWHTDFFTLYSLMRRGSDETLNVYLEGDGNAWLSPRRPSHDPTPRKPCAWWLASHDPSKSSVLYLARPAQYVNEGVAQKYWTYARFSRDVVKSMNSAISQAKAVLQAKKVVLVGFSGGAALAALIAAERDDVLFLASAGGNLNVDCWVRESRFTPLSESLDPMTVAGRLARIPQRHMLGSEDSVIPRVCWRAFGETVQRNGGNAEMRIVPKYAHTGEWQKVWEYNYISKP